MQKRENFFTHKVWVPVLALTCAFLWGWAFPLLKLGFAEFGITAEMTASKMVYAGLRFTFAGLFILIIASILHKDFRVKPAGQSGNDVTSSHPSLTRYLSPWLYILAFALMNTTLHYAFFYIGMSHSVAARASILNSMGTFILVILACMFFFFFLMTFRQTLFFFVCIAGIFALPFFLGSSGFFFCFGV